MIHPSHAASLYSTRSTTLHVYTIHDGLLILPILGHTQTFANFHHTRRDLDPRQCADRHVKDRKQHTEAQ